MPTCDILLACYNGTKYGPELLDSLLGQTDQDFKLIVRDNGSTDGSMDMLRKYQPRFGGRMNILNDARPTGSPQGNFSILLTESQADFILFADIDDIWHPHKVAFTKDFLLEHQATIHPKTPLYIFTDVTPVNAELQPIIDSFWRFKRIDPEISQHLNRCLVCPPMLGCASGINQALARLMPPVPAGATGHDWWGLLIAAALGKVAYSHERTMLYRLHQSNDSAQKRVSLSDYAKAENWSGRVRRGMQRRCEQAQALLEVFGPEMSPAKRKVVERFVSLQRSGPLRRRFDLLRGAYLYPDFARNVAMMIAN